MSVLTLVLVCAGFCSVLHVQAADSKDFTELERQIGIANGLEYYDYTKESWEVLQSAVEAGNKLLGGTTEQSKLNLAAEDIEHAREHLVKMDYSALTKVLDEVYAEIDENPEMHDIWYRLDKAVDKARPLLVSGDQQAVNEMTEILEEIIGELSAQVEVPETPGVIIQEVEVEVPPVSDFCNIPKHRTWLLLLAVSVGLNILLFVTLSTVVFRKRNTTDNMPLVNYDIDDDIDLNELN